MKDEVFLSEKYIYQMTYKLKIKMKPSKIYHELFWFPRLYLVRFPQLYFLNHVK